VAQLPCYFISFPSFLQFINIFILTITSIHVKVAELEEQLNTVTLQRKKAEKATAAVLAILENHGIGDASDGFDSGSDQDAVMCESNVSDSKDEPKEARDNDGETYSSSEIDSSPSTGRSLSWKSDRESLHSSNRKKYIDSARRSSSFASTGTSSKHVGKSCRRIRRRETRSVSFLLFIIFTRVQGDDIECHTLV